MINKEYKINLKYFFYKSDLFEVPNNNYEIQSGDMIRCANCDQLYEHNLTVYNCNLFKRSKK